MKLCITLVILALVAAIGVVMLLRKTVGRHWWMALACALIIASLIAPVQVAHAFAGTLLIGVLYVGIKE